MSKLLLKANGSNLEIKSPYNVVSTQVNYDTCEFSFNAEWDGYTKTAVFYSDSTEKKSMQISNDSCVIPWENLVNSGVLYIGVYGSKVGSTLPTNFVMIPIIEGSYKEATGAQAPTQDIYTQILNSMTAYNLAEEERSSAELIRLSNENLRQYNTGLAISNAEDAILRANQAALAAEDAVSGLIGLPDIGIPGTYTKVETDAKGRIINGTTPTAIGDLGITNVYTKTEVDTATGAKFDKTSIVQTTEVSDATKVPSSVVTNGMASQISSLTTSVANINNNLIKIARLRQTVTTIANSLVPVTFDISGYANIIETIPFINNTDSHSYAQITIAKSFSADGIVRVYSDRAIIVTIELTILYK